MEQVCIQCKALEVDAKTLGWQYECRKMDITSLEEKLQKRDKQLQASEKREQNLQSEVMSLQKEKKEGDELLQKTNDLLKAKSAQLNVLQHEDSSRVVTYLQDKLHEAREQTRLGATMEISSGGGEVLDVSVTKLKAYVYLMVSSVYDKY